MSLLERLLPWTCTGQFENTVIATKPEMEKHMADVIKSEYRKATNKEIPAEKKVETKPEPVMQPKPYVPKTVPTSFENTVPENSNTPLLEMWNVLESVGIRRDNLDRVFRTDEAAVSELYSLVERRLHYQREQDMIRRLKAHVEKIAKTKTAPKQ